MAVPSWFWPAAAGMGALVGAQGYQQGGLFGKAGESAVDDDAIKKAVNEVLATPSRSPITVSYGPDPKGRTFKLTKSYPKDATDKLTSLALAKKNATSAPQAGMVGKLASLVGPAVMAYSMMNRNKAAAPTAAAVSPNAYGQPTASLANEITAELQRQTTGPAAGLGAPTTRVPQVTPAAPQDIASMPGGGTTPTIGGDGMIVSPGQQLPGAAPSLYDSMAPFMTSSYPTTTGVAGVDPFMATDMASMGGAGGFPAGEAMGSVDSLVAMDMGGNAIDSLGALDMGSSVGYAGPTGGEWLGSYTPYIGAGLAGLQALNTLGQDQEYGLGTATHYGGVAALNFVPYVGPFLAAGASMLDAREMGKFVESSAEWLDDAFSDVFDAIGDLF